MQQLNGKMLIQIASGLPRDIKFEVNGEKCNSVNIKMDDDGIYVFDLKHICEPINSPYSGKEEW